MSLSEIQPHVEQFAADKAAEVLIIKGRWGVGKTFFWKALVEQLAKEKRLSREHYTYVSLFGLGDLVGFKAALFANKQSVKELAEGEGPSALNTGSQWLEQLSGFDKLKGLAGLAEAAAWNYVRDMLICIDDLERRSSDLDIRDVIGLVSQLKEDRNCQVCLILNDDFLDTEEGEEFRHHAEKVVDLEVHFAPTSEEAFDIVVPEEHPHRPLLSQCAQRLSITNIRILQRIVRNVNRLAEMIDGRTASTIDSVIRATALLTWAYYDTESVPVPFERARLPRNEFGGGFITRGEWPEDEKAWFKILSDYESYIGAGLDQDIADFVEKGYFAPAELSKRLDEKDQETETDAKQQARREAWNFLYDSFDDNEEEVIDCLITLYSENPETVSPNNLEGVFQLLRVLGYDEKANELVDAYVRCHRNNPDLLELRDPALQGSVTDQYILQRFAEACSEIPDQRTIDNVIQRILLHLSYDSGDLEFLARCTVENYTEFFKRIKGKIQRRAVDWCLEFRHEEGITPRRPIADRAIQALQRIASENRLNRYRIKMLYKIDPVPDEDANESDS